MAVVKWHNRLWQWSNGITDYGSHKWHGGGGDVVTNYGSGRKDVVNRCLEFGPIVVSRLSIVAHQKTLLNHTITTHSKFSSCTRLRGNWLKGAKASETQTHTQQVLASVLHTKHSLVQVSLHHTAGSRWMFLSTVSGSLLCIMKKPCT